MAISSSVQGVWFPQWAGVLAQSPLKELERRAYYRAIVEYLRFCKQSRQRATVASARLRVKDVDFERNQIIVHGDKGDKDRVTMLP